MGMMAEGGLGSRCVVHCELIASSELLRDHVILQTASCRNTLREQDVRVILVDSLSLVKASGVERRGK